MTLTEMRGLVRRDLKDEDAANYRWTNDEIDRAIQRAVMEFSLYIPREMKSTLATTAGSRSVNISTLTERVSVDALEYPMDKHPKRFRKFAIYQDILTILSPFDPSLADDDPDGSNCYVYWSKIHTLDATTSTIPKPLEHLIALGASGFAVTAQSQYQTDRANIGGDRVDRDYSFWGRDRLREFRQQLKQNSTRRKLRSLSLRGLSRV